MSARNENSFGGNSRWGKIATGRVAAACPTPSRTLRVDSILPPPVEYQTRQTRPTKEYFNGLLAVGAARGEQHTARQEQPSTWVHGGSAYITFTTARHREQFVSKLRGAGIACDEYAPNNNTGYTVYFSPNDLERVVPALKWVVPVCSSAINKEMTVYEKRKP